jgi:predicted nucleotidyltransferase
LKSAKEVTAGMRDFDISLWEKLKREEFASRERKRGKTLTDVINSLKIYFSSKKVGKVFLIGSVLKKGGFYDFSDIDIAVEGLAEDYFHTLSDLETLLEREVDLIELEGHRLREEIEKWGKRIK